MTHLNDLSKVYLEHVSESAVPGKPAEKLGAVTAIPKSEQEAARERLLAKAKAKREATKTESLDPVGQEDADVDNDGDVDSSDKYLKKRRKAIGKAIDKKKKVAEAVHATAKQMHSPHEVPSGDLKKLVKKAVKRIDTDVDGDTDKNDKAKGELGEFIPGVNNKRLYSSTKTTTAKESFSNWRHDLTEVITDIESKPIKEKKVNNKVTINPKLGEALEEIGATLIEMVEIDEFDYVIEDVYVELQEEGYDEDDIEEAIEYALTEAKVTFGHDTEKPHEKDTSAGRMVKAVGRLARQKLKSAGKKAKMKAAQAQVAAYNKKKEVEQSAGDVARRTKRTAEIAKKRASEAKGKAKSGLKSFVKRQAQKVVDRMSEETVNEAVKGQDTEMRKAAAADRKSGDKRLSPSAGKANADKMERDIKFYDKVTKKTKPSVVGMTHEETQLDEKALSKAQQRFFGMVRATQKGEMENPSPEVAKAAAGMTKKQAKDFAKTKHKGLPQKKEVKEGATEAPMSPQEIALQKRKTQIDQMIARKRQQSLQKANKPADKPVNEASEDRLRDQRMERGGVDGNANYRRPPAKKLSNAELGIKPGKTAVQKAMEKKGKSALDIVKSEIRAKHGKGAIMGDK